MVVDMASYLPRRIGLKLTVEAQFDGIERQIVSKRSPESVPVLDRSVVFHGVKEATYSSEHQAYPPVISSIDEDT
jgi:hypothetical protein